MGTTYTKMSKSRGNVITPDEVIYGVAYFFEEGYDFRDSWGRVVDYQQMGVWRNKGGDGFYYTSTRTGRQPVFLCTAGEPCRLLVNGEEVVQHPSLLCCSPVGRARDC